MRVGTLKLTVGAAVRARAALAAVVGLWAGGGVQAWPECIEQCVETPVKDGHFDCCTNPLVSSFQKPSCATGCLMMDYAQNLAECDSWCEEASKDGCDSFQIPALKGPEGRVQTCGECACGLRDCPGHAPPEPESCKDPTKGGPAGGDCGWVNRCRGSVEGCKRGCMYKQAINGSRTSWGFVLVLLFAMAGYTAGGVGLAVKRSGAPLALTSHPHHHRWREFVGLVMDGVELTRAKATGKSAPRSSAAVRGGYKAVADPGGGNPGQKASSKQSEKTEKKEKKAEKKGKKAQRGGDGGEGSPDAARAPTSAAPAAAPAAVGATAGGPKATSSGGGGRWVHVPT